jgi:hypothetical protein
MPIRMPIGVGFFTSEGISLARKKKKKVNEIAIKKCINNPHKANRAGLEKVFGSKAPLATPRKTCIGAVSLFINACIHAAVMSNAPAIKPAVNALVKNDLLIKVLVYIPDDKSRQFAAGI